MNDPNTNDQVIDGEIVFSAPNYSLHQLCFSCRIQPEYLFELVAFGIIHVTGTNPSAWLFKHSDLLKVSKALRLQKDFSLDQQGLALTLELLDEIENLRLQITRLTPYDTK